MNDAIETMQHRQFVASIFYDDDAESPENDNDDVFLVASHRQFTVKGPGKLSAEDIRDSLEVENERDNDGRFLGKCGTNYRKEYHIFPLIAYIHSGIALSLSHSGYPFSDPWDSGQIGYVLVKKGAGFRNIKKTAESYVKYWNGYLSGERYGYAIEEHEPDCRREENDECDCNTESVDSCWGFDDLEYMKSEITEIMSRLAEDREELDKLLTC